MKKITRFLLATVLVSAFAFSVNATVAYKAVDVQQTIVNPQTDALGLEGMTVEDFLDLRPRDVREMTGERLGLKGAVALKAAQKAVKKELRRAETDSGKSQLVALILVLVIGYLGIHRFYLGYTGIGIIQLLTLGGCGIWALVDMIRIITGDLKPKDGEYEEKL
jgi:TM2 domain-containing membrane protein YozV